MPADHAKFGQVVDQQRACRQVHRDAQIKAGSLAELGALFREAKRHVSKERDGTPFAHKYVEIDLRHSYGVYLLFTCGSGRKLDSHLRQPAIVQLALGDTHTCLLRASGLVRCWGGDGVPILTNAGEIAAVGTQSYARLTDGSVVQWTRSSGPTSPAAAMPPEPVMPAPMYGSGESFPLPTGDYVEIYAGRRHTCGRRSGGSVWCWGQNVLSQLGRETGELTETGASYPAGETLLAGARMDALVLGVGRDHSCVALRDGRVMCWGSNSEGQLGRWVAGLETLEPVEPNSFFY